MNPNLKRTHTRSRGLILTEHALTLLDQALRKWWENSAAREKSKTGKLSREAKAEGFDVNVQTVDKIYRRERVDEVTLRHVFETRNILPLFSKERYCVSTPPTSSNLPRVFTPCIGRKTEVTQIKARLKSNNLVTLTGVGGIGKTRLALQVAAEAKSHYSAGIWFVKLAGLAMGADQALVLQTIAETLGVQEEKHSPLLQTLSDFLREKPLLLILDNCEHLLDSCATLVDHLLTLTSALRVLATSRERLNIPSEFPFRVPSLALPDMQCLVGRKEDITTLVLEYDSVRLFVEQARVHHPEFTVTNQNAYVVASVCRRLDGIPLALELAAARMGAMTIYEVESGLNDCFHLLTGGSRAALPRHQTLRATMDWSYNLLEEKEQALFRRLTVFADGCHRASAEQVCIGSGIEEREVLDLLTSLVDKNLVLYQEREDKARYHLSEPVHQYGRFRLTETRESDTLQGRHRDFFLALAEEAEPYLTGLEQRDWLQRLEVEHDNLRAALASSCASGEVRQGLRLAGALWRFWHVRGYYQEGLFWFEKLLQQKSMEIDLVRAKALNGAGNLAFQSHDYKRAQTWFQERLEFEQVHGSPRTLAGALGSLANVASELGDYLLARTLFERSLAQFRAMEDMRGIVMTQGNLAVVSCREGNLPEACDLYEECAVFFRSVGDKHHLAIALNNIVDIRLSLQDFSKGTAMLIESLNLGRNLESRHTLTYSLILSSSLLAQRGSSEEAAILLGATEAFLSRVQLPMPFSVQEEYGRNVERLRISLGPATLQDACDRGRLMTQEETITFALISLAAGPLT